MDKPCRKSSSNRDHDQRCPAKTHPTIKFNLAKDYLQCFISARTHTPISKEHSKILPPEKPKSRLPKAEGPKVQAIVSSLPLRKSSPQFHSSFHLFNNKVLVLEYGQDELYIDSTKTKNRERSESSSSKQGGEDGEDEFVASCVRVITEETDNTSNPVTARYSNPQNYQYYLFDGYTGQQRERARNRRAVSLQESTMFHIDLTNIEKDGRTTLMLRNIPNKYTRDMLLQEIDSWNFKKKYDFFYLPIDFRNQCNVGYAFINFIHTKFIPEFYQQFHLQKWDKFNSQKICQVCYARIQGTAQLVNHFKDSTVIQQKDKKLRPLIDVNYTNLASIVERQRTETGKTESPLQEG